MREVLSDLGCPVPTHNYLGDGVYCGLDPAGQIWLITEVHGTINKIAIEPTVMAALMKYAKRYLA